MAYKDPAVDRAYMHEYRTKNAARIAAHQRAYGRINRARITAQAKHSPKRKAWLRRNAAKLRNYNRVATAKRRANNLDKARQYGREYKRRPEVRVKDRIRDRATGTLRAARRKAFKAAAPLNDFTAAQWKDMKASYQNTCVYCGKKTSRLSMDHLTPLSQGGSHTLHNIVPACISCNSSKHAGPVPKPVQPLLL